MGLFFYLKGSAWQNGQVLKVSSPMQGWPPSCYDHPAEQEVPKSKHQTVCYSRRPLHLSVGPSVFCCLSFQSWGSSYSLLCHPRWRRCGQSSQPSVSNQNSGCCCCYCSGTTTSTSIYSFFQHLFLFSWSDLLNRVGGCRSPIWESRRRRRPLLPTNFIFNNSFKNNQHQQHPNQLPWKVEK